MSSVDHDLDPLPCQNDESVFATHMARTMTGSTGRYSKLDADAKREIDMTQITGGLQNWREEAFGIVIQEGRFNADEVTYA